RRSRGYATEGATTRCAKRPSPAEADQPGDGLACGVALVLAIPGSEYHATQLAQRLGVAAIVPRVRRFPDGEIYVRIDHELTGHDVVVVGSLSPEPAETFLTVAFVAATARDLGAARVGLVAPYLAFMRQDIRFHPGEGVTSRYFARLVSG